MANEEIVLKRLEKLAKSPLHFETLERYYYISDDQYNTAKKEFQDYINILTSANTIEKRVHQIFSMNKKFRTYRNKRFQARSGSNRSAQDIWRIYKYYFPKEDIDIFSIMRALYKLTFVDNKLKSYRCPVIRKQVFWLSDYGTHSEAHCKADLGVPLSEWENIGINNKEVA